jgi:formylglycine-generating enzyme required for sulfatase activity
MSTPFESQTVGRVFRDAPFAPEMVVLPSGKFLMGSPIDGPSWYEDQDPQHEVTIAYQLAMGKYPVTFDEWDAYVADGGTTYVPDDGGWGRGKRPVIQVCWSYAQQYVAWLNKKLGRAADDPTRYRLPSEAEWEYACRAGTQGMYSTPDGLMCDDWANYDASDTFEGAPRAGRMPGKTTPVGTYPANPWGLYDMHGNVWEWMQDWYHWGLPRCTSGWQCLGRSRSSIALRVARRSWDAHPQNLCSSSGWVTTTTTIASTSGFG